jgi:hypothetical protein
MGHWLDGLFASGGIIVEWDAISEPLPEVGVLRFDGSFSVEYDASGKKALIGIRSLELDGNVVGDSDENRVTTISGDEETDAVLFECGTQFQPRTITTTNQTLAPTDTLVFVATGEGEPLNVKLPAPSDGRTFVLALTGVTGSISLRRFGSELINSEASHLGIDSPCIVIVVTDGTDWTAYPITDAGGGGTEEAAIVFSAVDTLAVDNNAPQTANANQSQGVSFFIRPGPSVDIVGIRFRWQSALGETVKCGLYSAAGALLASVNVVTSGAGLYEGEFASPVTPVFNRKYIASVHDVAGGTYSFYDKTAACSLTWPALPFFGGRRIGWMNFALYHTGDASPDTTANTEVYPAEPMLQE